MPRLPIFLLYLVLSLTGSAVRAADSAPGGSPMVPASGSQSAPSASGSDGWEMLGINQTVGSVIVSIRNVSAEQSQWLRPGDQFGALRLLSADPEIGKAEVEIDGKVQTLTLRMPDRNANARAPIAPLYNPSITPGTPEYEQVKEREQLVKDYRGQLTAAMTRPGGPGGLGDSTAAAAASSANTAAANTVASNQSSPKPETATSATDDGKTLEQREKEARELMSDMLEIGMIQRRAYEQLKEAADREAAGSAH